MLALYRFCILAQSVSALTINYTHTPNELCPNAKDFAQQAMIDGANCPLPVSGLENRTRSPGDKNIKVESVDIGLRNCKNAQRGNQWCKFPTAAYGRGYTREDVSEDLANEAVLNADKAFFDDYIDNPTPEGGIEPTLWIVLFYADWCPHCQNYAPVFFKLGVAMREANLSNPVRLAAIDCPLHDDICTAQKIESFPTIKWFYRGQNKELILALDGYMEEMQKKMAKAASTMKEEEEEEEDEEEVHGLGPAAEGCTPWAKKLVRGCILGDAGGYQTLAGKLPPGYMIDADSVTPLLIEPWAECMPYREANVGSGWKINNSTVETRIADATAMAAITLNQWVSPSVPYLAREDLLVLEAWLRVVTTSLPQTQFREPLQLVQTALEDGASLCISKWKNTTSALVEAYPQPANSSCTLELCRMWTLIHFITTSQASRTNATGLTPYEVKEAIIGFLHAHFKCQRCKLAFEEDVAMGMYDPPGKNATGDELIRYFWEFHVATSSRITMENMCSLNKQWPPSDVCPTCWKISPETKPTSDMLMFPVPGIANTDEIIVFMKNWYKLTSDTADVGLAACPSSSMEKAISQITNHPVVQNAVGMLSSLSR